MQPRPFLNRREAGRILAAKLTHYAHRPDVIVLALPRGGVPVGYEVAKALDAPFDIFLVRKLGVPGYEELAMGAIATGGVRVLNEELIQQLGISRYVIDAIIAKEEVELKRRERLYRGVRPPPAVRGRTVILVDDGLATGATMEAAVLGLSQLGPARIVVAVPIAARETCDALRPLVDEVICAITPDRFHAVGFWYEDFSQTTDGEVRSLLGRPRQAEPGDLSRHDEAAAIALRGSAHALTGAAKDYDPLLERIGNARFVLLGEASHGTCEFYRERAEITKRLISELNFTAVAVEADWPDAYRVNRYVRGLGNDMDAREALSDFRRFPTWMWRNTEVVSFVDWLRDHNEVRRPAAKTGFYGLDLYSLHASIKAVVRYLERVDSNAAQKARERYACFDHFGEDTQTYGFMTGLNLSKSCEEEVIAQLIELRQRSADHSRRDCEEEDELFNAEQNAKVVKDAEHYYRTMFLKDTLSWNLRDRHMAETLDAVLAHLGRRAGHPKVAVWAHNSHIGDARATEMATRGELNIGQLAREKYGGDAVLVGFTTHHGTVTATSDWGADADRMHVLPALAGSFEALFHEVRPARFMLSWSADDKLAALLRDPRLERAIGVVYRPETERKSHYFQARLSDQFDAVLHFDETEAVKPLEYTADWQGGEPPETYPFAV